MAKTRGKNPSSPVLRVCELYAFDEQIRLGGGVTDSGLTPPPKDKPLTIAGFDEAGRGALAGPVVVGCVHFDLASEGTTKGFSVAAGGVINTKRNITPPKGHLPDGIETCGVGLHARRGTSILDFLAGIDDSKRVSVKKREALFPRITSVSDWGIGYAAPSEIDRVGIVPALTLAACRAYRAMRHPVDLLLLDRGLSLRERRTQGATLRPSVASGFTPDVEDCSVGLHARRSRTTAELAFTKGDSRSLHIAAASILAKVHRDRMMVKLNAQYPGYGLDSNKGYGTPVHLAALKRLGPSSIHRRSFRVH